MFIAAERMLGPGWTAWLPETVIYEVEREGGSEALDDELGAVLAIASTGAPWWSWQAFAAVAQAFSHGPVEPHGFIPPEPHEMAATVVEMTLVYGLCTLDDDFVPEFSDEVEAYVAAALAHNGICCAPDDLYFAQERLEKLVAQHTCARAKKAADAPSSTESEDPAPEGDVQAHRLEEIREYVKKRNERTLRELRSLA